MQNEQRGETIRALCDRQNNLENLFSSRNFCLPCLLLYKPYLSRPAAQIRTWQVLGGQELTGWEGKQFGDHFKKLIIFEVKVRTSH